MAKKISQREARQLRKLVAELERKIYDIKHPWGNDYPGGAHIATLTGTAELLTAVSTANRLGHPVVVSKRNGELHFYGVDAK